MQTRKTGNKFQPRRFCLSQGFTHSRNPKVSGTRKVGPSVHWTIPSSEEGRSRSIPTGVTRRNVGYTPGVPCVPAKEIFKSTGERACAGRRDRSTDRPSVPGNTCQDFWTLSLGGQETPRYGSAEFSGADTE